MGGEGAMSQMVHTIRQNRNLRRSKRRSFRNADTTKTPQRETTTYTYPNYSDYKLSKIKKNAKRMRERNRAVENIIYSLVIGATLLGLIIMNTYKF